MKTFIQPTRLAVLSCLAAMQWAAHAQSTTPLTETVVTASRIEQPLADVLSSVTLITRADIERSQAASVADLLQGEAGFEFGRNGGPGTTTSFFLRGAESKNLVVMIDGVRTMVDGIGSLTAIDLPLQQIERIELLRGNASGLYGEAAIGGVVQIFTRGLGGKSGAYGSATLGSRNSQGLNAGYAGQHEDVSFRIDAGREHADGFSAMNPGQSINVNPDNDALNRTHVGGKLIKRISTDLSLGVYAAAVKTDSEFDKNSDTATDRHLLRTEYALLNGHAQMQFNRSWKSRVDISRTNLEIRDFKNETANRTNYNAGLMQGEQNSLRWFNTYSASGNSVINFGLDASNESYTADAIVSGYQARRQMRGYFAGLNQTLGRLSLQANLRHDLVAVNKADTAVSSAWANTSGLFGLGYQLVDAWRLTAAVSTGFRAPSASDLSSNIDLKPETHLSQEIGVTRASAGHTFRAVVFDTRTTDAIYYQPWPQPPVNVGKVRNQGVEVGGTLQWQGTHVRYSLVSQDPWNETNNMRLARRARLHGSLEAWRTFGQTTAGIKFHAADERKNSDYDTYILPGYSTLALYASRPLDKDWTVRVKVENALDRSYQLAYGYNTPPFGMWLTLAYQQR